MNRSIYLFLIVLFFSCSNDRDQNYAEWVDPSIGTGGHGHTYPGASAPFGFVQLSPDSRLKGWDGCGGYHYSDSVIYGFSHTHLSGTGVSDYGDILLMPTPKNTLHNGYEKEVEEGYGSLFSHLNEDAEAGYYRLHLESGHIDVELTTTKRAGFHRYQYASELSSQTRNLVLDLRHRDPLMDHEINFISDRIISGKRISKAWAQEQHIYFYLELSEPYSINQINEDSSVALLSFNSIKELKVKIGLSAVDILGAQQNLNEEIPHWSFDQTKKEVQKNWNEELSKIQVEMPNDSDRTIFYTALYHSFLNPNTFEDVDGRYRGTDLEIHPAKEHDQYTIFSLWDTYRATHPLFTLTQEKRTLDFIHTFLDHYQKGGKLPVWELAGNYTGCMIGYHSIPVIVDAYMKGIRDFDQELALEAMIATAKANELGKLDFSEFGYMAMDQEHESVSKNLEYAYDDWCIAIFAKELGKEEVYKEFIRRAQQYKNIFDPESGFMRAKRNQQFVSPFDPTEVNFNFTEANSWQYSFYVPQDIDGLIDLYGGKAHFSEKLDALFTASENTSGRHQVDITGLKGQYAHGNEPSHHMAYLYNYSDESWKTQKVVRDLLAEMYTAQADGLIGNEDCGQMSSWYVFSSLGFYPVTPASDEYSIGAPLVKNAQIQLENGKVFRIKTLNNSPSNPYIEKVSLNGKTLDRSYLKHEEILQGGELIFEMSSVPNKDLFEDSPGSRIDEHLISPVPYIKADKQVFTDSLLIELAHPFQATKLYYSIDEQDFKEYHSPFTIYQNTELRIKAKLEGASESKIGEAQFFKLEDNKKVSYNYPYNSQYTAGGKKGLVDLIRGGEDFRTGFWQGFQGEDIEITIELDESQSVSSVSAGFLQDINSWIWMPTEMEVLLSKDGKNFESLGKKQTAVSSTEYGVFLEELSIEFPERTCRFIQLKAKQYGTIPNWHLGEGGESFIFIDEIIIR